MPGTTFLPVAGPLSTLLAIMISAVIMLVIGYNYSYLMGKNPGIGGVYAYTKGVLGQGHAFLSAWFLCLSYLALIPQNATALAVMFRALFSEVFQNGAYYSVAGYDVFLGEAVVAVAVLVVLGVIVIYKKPLMQRLQTGLAIVLLAGVLTIAVIAAPKIDFATLGSVGGFGQVGPVRAVMSIVILAPWAFVGFEVISLETAHFQFPVRKSRLLIAVAILLGSFIYATMSVVAAAVVPDGYASWQAYIADLDSFTGYAALPTFFAARKLMGSLGLVVIAITAVSAVLSSVIGFYRATARILENMAEDHILTRRFQKSKNCFVFIMGISVAISFLGRNALGWVVDVSSFGAIVGFGYTAIAALRVASMEKNAHMKRVAAAGCAISVVFLLTQLLPKVSAIETMAAESYLLLALWCLLGFIFYWRTMRVNPTAEQGGESSTVFALFFLFFYASLVWYVKKMVAALRVGAGTAMVMGYSVVFSLLVVLGLVVMLRVLAQLRQRQAQLERERIRAVANSEAKSQFLFNMSHDIRTPMNAIMGFTHLALKEEAGLAEKVDYLRKIESSGKQLLGIIDEVLDMSHIENGRIELFPEPMSLKRSISEVKDLFAAQMEKKNINFTVEAQDIQDEWVLGDRNRLNRVALNLLSNALKFTPEGGEVRVTLRQTGREGEKGRYELQVRDNGIGMSPEFAQKIFMPFERERTSTVSGIQGTGLGLSITKGIVDMFGGDIEVKTAPGEGAELTVKMALPVTLPPEPTEPEKAVEALDFSSMRLLLVEDNPINMEIATMILSQAGFTLETAENGQIALDRVRESEPGYYDAILMDIQMPVMDGYTATRSIRALENKALASIPIIAMTANAFKEDELAARDAGMQGHIAKPLDIGKMMATISEVLSKARQK